MTKMKDNYDFTSQAEDLRKQVKTSYDQEERSPEEIVESGDRDFMDFAGFDFGGHMQRPDFENIRRYDFYLE